MTNIKRHFDNHAQPDEDRLGASAYKALHQVQNQLSYYQRPAVIYLASRALSEFLRTEPGRHFCEESRFSTAELTAYSERNVPCSLNKLKRDDMDRIISDMSVLCDHIQHYRHSPESPWAGTRDMEIKRVFSLIEATADFLDMTLRTTNRYHKNGGNIISNIAVDPFITGRFVGEIIVGLAEELKNQSFQEMLFLRGAVLLCHMDDGAGRQNVSGAACREMMTLLKNTSEMCQHISSKTEIRIGQSPAVKAALHISDVTAAYDWAQYQLPAEKAAAALPAKTLLLTIKRPAKGPAGPDR